LLKIASELVSHWKFFNNHQRRQSLTGNQQENKVETKDLAEFYGVTRQSVEKWTPEKRKQKTVQALANAEQPIVDLIADINKLAYIYDCQWLHGAEQKRWCWINRSSVMLFCYLFVEGNDFADIRLQADLHATDVLDQLRAIKTKLEELVYGVSSVD